MSLKIQNQRKFLFGNYIFLKEDDESVPVINTPDVFVPVTSIIAEENGLTFRIKKQDSEALYNSVMEMEDRVSLLLRFLDDDALKKMPDAIKAVFKYNQVDMDWECLRSNYFSSEQYPHPTIYLKSTPRTVMVNTVGEKLKPEDLSSGYFRFRIKAETVYIGAHNRANQVANLQLRILDMRFSKEPTDQYAMEEVEAIFNTKATASPANVLQPHDLNVMKNDDESTQLPPFDSQPLCDESQPSKKKKKTTATNQ